MSILQSCALSYCYIRKVNDTVCWVNIKNAIFHTLKSENKECMCVRNFQLPTCNTQLGERLETLERWYISNSPLSFKQLLLPREGMLPNTWLAEKEKIACFTCVMVQKKMSKYN
jgi:hypothetical protein